MYDDCECWCHEAEYVHVGRLGDSGVPMGSLPMQLTAPDIYDLVEQLMPTFKRFRTASAGPH